MITEEFYIKQEKILEFVLDAEKERLHPEEASAEFAWKKMLNCIGKSTIKKIINRC